MFEKIIEKFKYTEYVDSKGNCKIFALRYKGGWMLCDAGNDKNILPFAAFFKNKKDMKDSILFKIAKSITELEENKK